MNISRTHKVDREEDEEEMKIYPNADPINHPGVIAETNKTRRKQTTQQKGSDCVRMRCSRAAPVCLALLCFLLLTAVVLLRLHFCTNNTNCTHERNQLLTRITNNTEERDELLIRNTNLTEERQQLLTRYSDVTKERDELQAKNKQLLQDRLNQEKNELLKMDGWIYYKSSFYFISSEEKSWTESRKYCTDRGADLITIKNTDQQNFVQKISGGDKVWIGLNDRAVEGRWKWIDGSAVTTMFWHNHEPNGGRSEDCALNAGLWADYACDLTFQWICEKNILK